MPPPCRSEDTKAMRILVACEFSGIVREAFRAKGHDAWSCDLLESEDDSWYHFQEDALAVAARGLCVREVTTPSREWCRGSGKNDPGRPAVDYHKIYEPWDMMIAHPPCTYLCRAGWHWVNKPDCDTLPLKGEPRRRAAMEAREFFLKLWNCNIPLIAVENPRPICHVNLPKSSQVIQPWQFGHGEVKETHLWLKGLPPLRPTKIVPGREAIVHKMPPGPKRKQNRERTYQGIAKAMADQWPAPSPNR